MKICSPIIDPITEMEVAHVWDPYRIYSKKHADYVHHISLSPTKIFDISAALAPLCTTSLAVIRNIPCAYTMNILNNLYSSGLESSMYLYI